MSKDVKRHKSPNAFLTGVGSLANIFGGYYSKNLAALSKKSDRQSLAGDWKAVGGDIKKSLKNTAF